MTGDQMPGEKRAAEPENDVAWSPVDPKQRRHDTHDEEPPQRLPPNDSPPPPKQEEDTAASSATVHEYEDLDVLSDAGDPEDQEFLYVDLPRIRKEVQCPICLGIIKKTRTVMECLHRFCRECIDKSMRMGNNECPACRTHCASRRSLRDDPRYDAIIAALYPDIRKFEEEELAFCEEDETRNKQIQDSIAQVLRKQSEALGKKRPASKDTAGSSVSRPQRSCRNGQMRRRRRRRNASPEYEDSDYNNDADGIEKHPDADEHHTEIKQRKGRSRANVGSSHSPSSTNLSGGSFENNLEQRIEGRGLSPGLTCTAEMLAWGRGGVRSNSRSSSINGGVSRSARRIRLAKLVEFLRNLDENDDEYVVLQTSLNAEKVAMRGIQDTNSIENQPALHPAPSSKDKPSEVVDPLQNRLHMLNEEVLSGTLANCISNGEQLILAYQQKDST